MRSIISRFTITPRNSRSSVDVHIGVMTNVVALPIVLTWDVGGEHEYEEFYPDVPTALVRFAVISACSDANWWTKVRDNSTEFTRRTHEFFTDSLTA